MNHRLRLRVLLLWVLLFWVLLCVPTTWADDETPASRWEGDQSEAVARLEVLAASAQRGRLFAHRDMIYERILLFDPDHGKARRVLHYRRKGGEWLRNPHAKPSKNRGKADAQVRFDEAFEVLGAWFRLKAQEIVPEAIAVGDDTTLRQALDLALTIWPDDVGIRSLAGQARVGEGKGAAWALLDTARGLANRARYLEAARGAIREVAAARPGPVERIDRPGCLAWRSALQGKSFRIVGTVGSAEMLRHHEIAESAASVFEAVFGERGRIPDVRAAYSRGYPIYVTSNMAEGNAWLAGEPGIGERDFRFQRRLAATVLRDRRGILIKVEPRLLRCEGTSSLVMGLFQVEQLEQGGDKRGAWSCQGVSLYLRWLQVRSRRIRRVADVKSRYATRRPGVPTWEERLVDQTVDWHGLAADALREMSATDVHLLAGKKVNKMTSKDLLAGYGICAYVMEARPEIAKAFFVDVASQEQVDLDAVCREHLGCRFKSIHPHLIRWLDEMAKYAPPPGPVR